MSKSWSSEQEKLIEVHENGIPKLTNVAVKADAGSGKTSTLVERIKRMYEKNLKLKILCVSFTEKSAADLKDRLIEYHNCEVYTINGFCMKVIKEFGNNLGIAPVLRILNQEKADELFSNSFLKQFKRTPLDQSEMNFTQYYELFKNIYYNQKDNRIPELFWQNHNSDILTKFASELFAEYENAKLKANSIEFYDQEILCRKILNNKKAKQSLSTRYDFIFVDEFQDTNKIQADIINNLVNDPSKLYVVGDDKQSIYRFRGADVEVFNQFANERKNQSFLTKNFRSEKPILDLVNNICKPLIANYRLMEANIIRSSVKENIIHICEEKENSDRILSAIQACIENGHDLSDIVILLRRFTSIQKISNILSKNNIPFIATSSSQIKNDPIIRSLAKMWRWALDPNQKYFAAQCLASFQEPSDTENIEKLIQFHTKYLSNIEHPIQILEVLDNKFQCTKKYGVRFEEFKQFILSEFTIGLNSHEIAQELHRLLEHDIDVSNLVSSPPPPQMKGILRIMTVHAAKGLEFPAVILTDLSFKQTNRSAFLTKKNEKVLIRARDEDGDLTTSWEPFLELQANEQILEKAESARLLYVAMTRAQKTLVFVTDPPKENAKPSKSETWNDWVYSHLPKPKKFIFKAQTIIENKIQSSIPSIESIENNPPMYHKARVGVTEYLRNKKEEKVEDDFKSVLKPLTESIQNLKVTKNYSQMGIQVHKYIQFHNFELLWKYAKENQIVLKQFKDWLNNSEEAEIIFKETPGKRIFNEFLFEYSTNSTVLTGRIDRIVQTENEILIVDFKTIFRKISPTELYTEYSKQLELYSDAISKLFIDKNYKFRKIIIDLTCATGQVFHELI